ncbi:MAG: hypothetical protein GVY19_07815 [Bacteroidetes bacterium]|jgi:thiamine biosynthesis lipoprotein|nr:hypothetical protein [Bacteroidota bacterium]
MEPGKYYHNTFKAMGTRFDVVFFGVEKDTAQRLYTSIVAETKRIEQKLSTYQSNSSISLVNQYASQKELTVDQEIFDIILSCQEYCAKTLGYFDVSNGKVFKMIKGQNTSQLDDAFDFNINANESIITNPSKRTIKFTSEHVAIDLGGYGKGLALQRVSDMVSENQIPSGLINFGDSSIMGIGTHPFGKNWAIGIKNIYSPSQSACTIELNNQFLSVSGLQRDIETSNQPALWHIFNPKTKEIQKGNKMVCALTNNAIDSEILSTSLLLTDDLAEKKRILKKFFDCKPLITEIIYHNTPPEIITYSVDEI